MLKTIRKSFLAVVLAVVTLFALTSCVITGGGQTTTDPTLDAQAALSEFTEQVTFANTAEVTTSFNLPAAGKKGSYQIPITWTSSNEAVIAITDLVEGGTTSATHKKANVTRPIVGAEDVTVTLTAEFSLTYTKNDGTSATLKETKTYNFTVLAKTADADAPDDVDGLEVGVPYKLGMYQEAKGKTLYALNAMNGFYGASTETLEDADDVYVEEATNGYYIYFLDGTTKTYISCAYELGSDKETYHFNYKLTDNASTVWAYDATAQKLTTVVEETELVLGTKSSYYTFSADEENIYFAHFYESPTASMSEDEKKVAADVKALEIATTVTENITLPATGANGSTITWESSNTAAIATDGTVTRGAEDVVVTLTATIKSGEASKVVEFEVKVVGNNSGSVIELTVDSLEIENGKYLAGTPTVGGIGFEYIQLGNYGNGIQMRDKDGNTSKLWSTTALGTGIVKIELVFNSLKSTHDNQNAVIFSFGNAVDNLTYTTKLTTVAGTKTYTITPNANTYTYLYIEHDIEFSFYWDSIKIYYNAGTSGETPEQPVQPTDAEKLAEAKEALVLGVTEVTENITLPAAGLNDVVITWASNNEAIATDGTVTRGATDVEVTLTATLTLGEATDTKEFTVVVKAAEQTATPTYDVVTEYAENVAYKYGVVQGNVSDKLLFLTGEYANTYYGGTTTNAEEAADVYLVLVEGGYNLKLVKVDGTVLYINVVASGEHINIKFETAATSVWVYNSEYNTFTTNIDGTDYYIGTYSTHETMSPSKLSYAATSFVGHLYGVVTGGETPEQPVQPTDAEKLAEAKEALVLDVTEATENITLPAAGLNDVVITWASNNEAIATDGTVTRGATDVEVTLTATLTLGEATDTKEFTVVVKAAEQPAKPTVLATFEFGANGSASHVDGKEISSGTSYKDGSYTLTLTDVNKVYGGATDAKGNSCLKFGTGSLTGSITFTVPENVTSVTIYVAQYKANTTKVDINGTIYTVPTASNNGEYTAYTVDTTTVKTITVQTVSDAKRAMINTIVFTGLEA